MCKGLGIASRVSAASDVSHGGFKFVGRSQ